MILFFILINTIYCFIYPYNILCPNKQTSDNLVYMICAFDKICSELYNLPFLENSGYVPYGIQETSYYKNFHYIIKKTGLSYPMSINTFLTPNISSRTIVVNQVNLENGLYYTIWSKQWRRSITRLNYLVFPNVDSESLAIKYNNVNNTLLTDNSIMIFNSSSFNVDNLLNFHQNFDECKYIDDPNSTNTSINTADYLIDNFFNLTSSQFLSIMDDTLSVNIMDETDLKSANIILSTLHILNLYKEHISLEETCNDVNERLYFDPYSNEMRCVCLEGKSCDDESNDTNTILWIALFGICLIIIIFFVFIYTSIRILTDNIKIKKQ